MGKKFGLSCDKATTICDKNQYREASVLDKARLILHLLICKYCRDYSKQNSAMTGLFGKLVSPCDDTEGFPSEDKKRLQEKIESALKDKP